MDAKINKQEILKKANYLYKCIGKLPLSIFHIYDLKEVVKTYMGLPVTIDIEHFPVNWDFKNPSYCTSVAPISKTNSRYIDDNLLHIHFNKDGEIDNEPYVCQYVKTKRIDDMSWFAPLTLHKVNEAIEKVVDLFIWYCKELSVASIVDSVYEFAHDLTLNYAYISVLCKHYGVADLVRDLFFAGELRYFKYVKHLDDVDVLYAKLDKLKDFISNYNKLKEKHPMYIEMHIEGIGKFDMLKSKEYEVVSCRTSHTFW